MTGTQCPGSPKVPFPCHPGGWTSGSLRQVPESVVASAWSSEGARASPPSPAPPPPRLLPPGVRGLGTREAGRLGPRPPCFISLGELPASPRCSGLGGNVGLHGNEVCGLSGQREAWRPWDVGTRGAPTPLQGPRRPALLPAVALPVPPPPASCHPPARADGVQPSREAARCRLSSSQAVKSGCLNRTITLIAVCPKQLSSLV